MKNKILHDPILNQTLQETGFVVVDFFDPTQLSAVFEKVSTQINTEKFAANNHLDIDVSFHCTYLDPDKAYKLLIWKELNELIAPFLTAYFQDYKTIQANLFNKAPGTGFIAPHQNLTTVDEDTYTSVSIWIPLQDTTEHNGTLHFMPRSHGKFERFRNSNIHWAPMDAAADINAYHMVPVSLKVGQALIFDDSIVHASPDNLSAHNRYVFHYLAIPKMAQPIYCKRSDSVMQLIEVDALFWQTYTPGDPTPQGPIRKTVPFTPRVYTKQALLNELVATKN
jgi:hypothetical protein